MKIMKRLILLLAATLTVGTSLFAQQNASKPDKPELQEDIHIFLGNYFNGDKVKSHKVIWDGADIVAFNLILDSGTEVDFNRLGEWTEIEMAMDGPVPSGVVPEAIAVFVRTHHKGLDISEIEKVHSGYNVELTNGLDIEFTQYGELLKYD